jgi:hypothetical protein
MAYPQVIELFDSQSGGLTLNDDGILVRDKSLRWLVSGMASYDAAETKGNELAPVYLGDLRRNRLDVRSLGNRWYEITASYDVKLPDSEQNEDGGDDSIANTLSFDTTGGTEHITQTIDQNNNAKLLAQGSNVGLSGQMVHARSGEDATKPDLQGAINVEGDQVKGIDKVVPLFNWSETWVVPMQRMTNKYIGDLYHATGKVNYKDWKIFKAGEVLFMGVRGEATRGATAASLTFSFSARPNIDTYFKVGDVEVGGKQGWEQMSVMYETAATSGTIFRRPKYVAINAIYEAVDFSVLAIGGSFPAVPGK